MALTYEWRGAFSNHEVNALHAAAFETRVFSADEWNWQELRRLRLPPDQRRTHRPPVMSSDRRPA